jgi:hypothetical protein
MYVALLFGNEIIEDHQQWITGASSLSILVGAGGADVYALAINVIRGVSTA